MNAKLNLVLAVAVCWMAVLPGGCHKDEPVAASVDKDQQLTQQLVGAWERKVDLGSVVHRYRRTLGRDGALVMRDEACSPAVADSGGEADGQVKELTGKWSVKDGYVIYQVTMPNGDPLRMKYKVEKITAYELVESSSGVDGPTQTTFARMGAAKAAPTATTRTR